MIWTDVLTVDDFAVTLTAAQTRAAIFLYDNNFAIPKNPFQFFGGFPLHPHPLF